MLPGPPLYWLYLLSVSILHPRSTPTPTVFGSLVNKFSFAKSCFIALSLLSSFAFSASIHAVAEEASSPPNILFILADDLAWSDLGCYGHPWHRTPHLDKLAANGNRFTQAYAPAPICSASRASILTGKTPARLNFEFVTKNEPGHQKVDLATPLTAPPFTLNLPLHEQTIAERLSEFGYQTAFFGKWHLNPHHKRYLGWSPTHGPSSQGFHVAEEDFGAHPYAWKQSPVETIRESGEFAKDTMVEKVCQYLQKDHERPFFAMASSFYVHTPVRTPCQWLRDHYEQRIPDDSPRRKQRIEYAAFLETFDHHVGQILAALDNAGQSERTIVVFLSDNGGHPEYTANAPLRGSKWNLYEGGIRVPMIVRLPKQLARRTIEQPVVGYDLLPTMLEWAGSNADPSIRSTKDMEQIDGTSFASLLDPSSDRPANTQRNLLWHFPYYHPETGFAKAPESIGIDDFVTSRTRPQSAIRRGKYKLLHFAEDDRIELYDLSKDIGEQRDLSGEQADIARRLRDELQDELKRSNARFATANEF